MNRPFAVLSGGLILLGLSLWQAEAPARAPGRDADKHNVPDDVVRQVRAVLPDGWTVEAKGNQLTVRRKQAVQVVWIAPNAPDSGVAKEPPTRTETYTLTFEFGPRLDPEDYLRKKSEREKMGRDLSAMCAEMQRHIPHKFDSFIPDKENADDVKQVKEYEEAKKRLEEFVLPDYFTDRHGVRQPYPPLGWWSHIASPEVSEECYFVRRKVILLFQPYEMTTATYRAIKALHANLDSFELDVRHWPGKDKETSPSLTLTTRKGVKDRAKDWPVVTLSPSEAAGIIESLIKESLLSDLFEKTSPKDETSAGPCYTLEVRAGDAGPYRLNLGWDRATRKKLEMLTATVREEEKPARQPLADALRQRWPDPETPPANPSGPPRDPPGD
jgi:hypothetical protein